MLSLAILLVLIIGTPTSAHTIPQIANQNSVDRENNVRSQNMVVAQRRFFRPKRFRPRPRLRAPAVVRRHAIIRRRAPNWRGRFWGHVVFGVTLGTVLTVAANAVPVAPDPSLCWTWTNEDLTRGYWYYCDRD